MNPYLPVGPLKALAAVPAGAEYFQMVGRPECLSCAAFSSALWPAWVMSTWSSPCSRLSIRIRNQTAVPVYPILIMPSEVRRA